MVNSRGSLRMQLVPCIVTQKQPVLKHALAVKYLSVMVKLSSSVNESIWFS